MSLLNNLGNIGEILFWIPVSILAMAFLGLLWSPIGALVCGLIALYKKKGFMSYAGSGAKCSSLLVLPWFYLLVRLAFGKSLSTFVVISAYVLIYAVWIYFVVLSVGGLLISIIDLLVIRTYSFQINMIAVIVFGVISPFNIHTFIASMNRLRRKHVIDSRDSGRTSTSVSDGVYLEPFAWLIGWSIAILFATVLLGLLAFTEM